jgi:MFS family permease
VPLNSVPSSNERRDLYAIVADGVSFSVMVGLGETYIPAFVLAAGHGEVAAGLIATLPVLGGAVFQLVTPFAVRRLHSYRRWVVACASLQGLALAPLAIGGARGHIELAWLALATVAYWTFGMATGPAWNAWVTTLVRSEIRKQYFARRARLCHAALFAAMLAGGLALQWGKERGSELALYAALFGGALLARLVSASFLARQSEQTGLVGEHRAQATAGIGEAIRSAGSGRVLAYLLTGSAMVNVSAPYFTPYMFGPLGLSYARFMTLIATALVARIAILPYFAALAERRGTRVLLVYGAFGIVPLPVLWLVSDHFAYLVGLQVAAGTAWAALEFATMLSFFEGIADRDRARVLSAFNLANATAVAIGALIGSQIFSAMDRTHEAYAMIFVVSTAGRMAALWWLRRGISLRDS